MANFALKRVPHQRRRAKTGKRAIPEFTMSEKELRELDKVIAEMRAGKRYTNEHLFADV